MSSFAFLDQTVKVGQQDHIITDVSPCGIDESLGYVHQLRVFFLGQCDSLCCSGIRNDKFSGSDW